MESLSVTGLRDLARGAMLESGARGFMRFAPEGGALLVTDAAGRCADGGAAMCAALEAAGFICESRGALTLLTPGDALLARLCAGEQLAQADWDSPLHPAMALALRLMREDAQPLSPAGRALVMDAARLCWQPREKALAGLAALRAQIALRLRAEDRNGLYQTGRLLGSWCMERVREENAR